MNPMNPVLQPEIGSTLNPAKTVSGIVQLSNSFLDSGWPKAIGWHMLSKGISLSVNCQ
jgi:uncharacterized protein with NRDE domain